ncbi:MAG: NAD(P)/FAD-dependent oxidoreductase [Anderseniella sp.]|jgi:putative flavoprotein involved in K+ transport|nr:NAD(P)/FAD-dependent oxidoreductase [Anderseniella sp.]
MKRTTTIVIGAGHAGLAMSHCLAERSIDHVLLERGEVGNAWKAERWKSLNLLTPNWQNGLPGAPYAGSDPDGYMPAASFADRLGDYARRIGAPVETGTKVLAVTRDSAGYRVETTHGDFACASLVIASGACSVASVPAMAAGLPSGLQQFTPVNYQAPEDMPRGRVLVVGASASGVQIAREIQRSDRQVTLAAGSHTRLPRTYRGRDIEWWLEVTGALDVMHHEVDDLERVRRTPSPQLAGTPEVPDLNALQLLGVEIVGRLCMIRDGRLQFSGGLANVCTSADLKMHRFLDSVDAWIETTGHEAGQTPPNRPDPTRIPVSPRLGIDLASDGFTSVIWATGYRPDHSWLHLPVFDRKGRLRHHGGIVADAPGVYAMGLPFMRRRKSLQIAGAAGDAAALADHLAGSVGRIAA